MHYIDRVSFGERPTAKLDDLNSTYKVAWATYNSARINKIKPLPTRPPSGWTHDDIRNPLKKMFHKNCAYCGTYTDTGNDAEVDHHHPTSLDEHADKVFCWKNYVWSCHPCNGKKSNNIPFLDPCLQSDMEHIYFNRFDGRYLYQKNTPPDIIDKFNKTEEFSYINGKTRPESRKVLFRELTDLYLPKIKLCHKIYTVNKTKHGEDSAQAQAELIKYNKSLEILTDKIKAGHDILLMKEIFDSYGGLSVTFDELLTKSNYLD